MRFFICVIFLYFSNNVECRLWSKGVVHYAINKKDYDLHSQDIIMTTFEKLEKEICVKFFNTPLNHTVVDDDRILYISNPDKRKTCPPDSYNFDKTVVDMPIGYRCMDYKNISKIVLDMLRASIGSADKPSSNDLVRKFQAMNDNPNSTSLLSPTDRDFINTHYFVECGNLMQKPVETRRVLGGSMELSAANERFYNNKLWPLGIVMYAFSSPLMGTPESILLQKAMTIIESASCIVFQQTTPEDPLQPRNLLWFGMEGEEVPNLGFMEGNQSVNLDSMIYGAPGHNAHTLNFLMRILGIPMMSNRYDRTDYIIVNWYRVNKAKKHLLEYAPRDAWLQTSDGQYTAYDFDSVTHAPANFMCDDCSLGARTVEPIQDHLWERTLSMGHRDDLSPADIEMLHLLYARECQLRFMSNTK